MPVCYGVTGISVLARQIHDYMTFVVFGVIFAFSALIWLAFYTVSPKKQDTELLPITSPNINRFSKIFR